METKETLLASGFVALDCIEGFKSKSNDAHVYYINKLGDIYSLRKDKVLKKLPHTIGYVQTYLTNFYGGGRWYKVHRLVAMQFLANPNGLTDVNHKNGNKKDNRVSNLEWLSHSDNIKHSYKTLGRRHNPACSFKAVKCTTTGEEYESLKAAAEATGCRIPNISAVIAGRLKSTGRLKFIFIDRVTPKPTAFQGLNEIFI